MLLLGARQFELFCVDCVESMVENSAHKAFVRACLEAIYVNSLLKIRVRLWKIPDVGAAEKMTEFWTLKRQNHKKTTPLLCGTRKPNSYLRGDFKKFVE